MLFLPRGAISPSTRGRGADTGLLASKSVYPEYRRQSHRYINRMMEWKRDGYIFTLWFFCTFPISYFCVPTGQTDGGVVEAVMKMWPPPAAPKDRDPERDVSPRGSSHVVPQSPSSSSSFEGNQPFKSTSSRPSAQPDLQRAVSHPGQPNDASAAVNTNTPQPPGYTFILAVPQCHWMCSYWFRVTKKNPEKIFCI